MQIAHSALSTVGIAGRRVVATGRLDGSSPHARGTRSARSGRRPRQTVHPRMCGERPPDVPDALWRDGSSPHARGTRAVVDALSAAWRFIPACAGNADHHLSVWNPWAVHPRICGERSSGFTRTLIGDGSSLHARGTPAATPLYDAVARFIPACAGNASGPARPSASAPVHPRMCGERGVVVKTHDQPPWFIPACAGNARTRRTPGSVAPVHPRMRGERSGSICARLTSSGSSPHARGTLFASAHNVPSCRFIPAYAGNAIWLVMPPPLPPVHPRIRGERLGYLRQSIDDAGSSPHTRGTPLQASQRLADGRFIPAYAGNAQP